MAAPIVSARGASSDDRSDDDVRVMAEAREKANRNLCTGASANQENYVISTLALAQIIVLERTATVDLPRATFVRLKCGSAGDGAGAGAESRKRRPREHRGPGTRLQMNADTTGCLNGADSELITERSRVMRKTRAFYK